MGFDGLAIGILHHIGVRPLERTGCPAGECGGVASGLDAVAACLVTDQAHVRVVEERVEDADGVGSPADAGGDRVGQPTGLVQHLGPGLQTDDALEVAHHQWERMWSGGGAEAVVGVVGVGHPVPEGLVDGVLEGLRSRLHRHDRRT